MTLLVVLLAFAVVGANVTAAEAGAQPAAMEEVNLDEEALDLEEEDFDDQELLDEVDFEDSTGLMFGLQIVMGDRVRYLVNIDYITMDFDVNAPLGVTPDDEEFELEGLAVQFGVRGEF